MSLLLLFSGAGTAPAGNNGSLDQTLGALALNAAGQVIVSGSLSQTLDALTLSAQGDLGNTNHGSLDATLGALTLNGAGTVLVSGALDKILGSLTLSAQGTSGVQIPAPVKLVNEVLLSAGSKNSQALPRAVTSFVNGQPVAAKSTAVYTANLIDNLGKPVPASALGSLTLTLYDNGTNTVLVGNPPVDILNADRGSIDAVGNLAISLSPADTAIIQGPLPAGRLQYRSIVIDWTYNGGTASGRHQINFAVIALAEA